MVDDALLQAGNHPGLPSQAALLRHVNRAKAKVSPEEPWAQDLMTFKLDEQYIPDDFDFWWRGPGEEEATSYFQHSSSWTS